MPALSPPQQWVVTSPSVTTGQLIVLPTLTTATTWITYSNLTMTATGTYGQVQGTVTYDAAHYPWPRQEEARPAGGGMTGHLRAAEAERRRGAYERTARARLLFESLLDDAQRADLATAGHVLVTGASGRRYRIRTRDGGVTGNVDLLDATGNPALALCAHLPGREPSPDHWAAQLLALRTDDERFIRTANIFQRYQAVPDDIASLRAAA